MGPVAPPGALPRTSWEPSCTHALSPSRGNPCRSTSESRMFAMSSCQKCARLTDMSDMSLLVDRQSGRCIATSAWESIASMRSSAERVAIIRDHVALMFDGSASVEEWHIASLHRRHRSPEGAFVRATWLKVVPDQLERSLDFYRMAVLPEMERLEGFSSSSLMIDHPAGRRAVSCSTFDSQEAMARNSEEASELRSRRARDSGRRDRRRRRVRAGDRTACGFPSWSERPEATQGRESRGIRDRRAPRR